MLNESRNSFSLRQTTACREMRGLSKPAHGFTMVELVISMLIVAILAAIAIPAFNSNAPSAEANALLGTVEYARSAAVKQGQNIIVCPSTDGIKCTGATAWATGWIVLAPASGACPVSGAAAGGATGDLVLKKQTALTSNDVAKFFPQVSTNTNLEFCVSRMGFVTSGETGFVRFDSTPVNLNKRRCLMVTGVGHTQVLSNGQSDINTVVCQ